MSSRSLGTLTLDLIAQTGGFTEGMTKAERAAVRANEKIRKETAQTIDTVASWGAATVAAAAAVGVAIGAMVLQETEAVAAQNDLAQALGVTHRELVTLERAASASGVSSDELSVAMKKLNKTIGDAQGGSKSATEALGALGLKADQMARLPMDQRFDAIAKAVSGMVTQTERAAAVQDIMGKSAQALLPMLQDGGEALEEAARQTREWGLALSQLDVSKIAEADDRIADLSAVMKGIRQQIAAEFAPMITVLSEKLLGAATSAGRFRHEIFEAFRIVLKGGAYAANVIDTLAWGMKALEVTVLGAVAAYHQLDYQVSRVGNRTAEDLAMRKTAADAAADAYAQAGREFIAWTKTPLPTEKFDAFMAEVAERAKQHPVVLPVVSMTFNEQARSTSTPDTGAKDKPSHELLYDAHVKEKAEDDRRTDERLADLTNWQQIEREAAENTLAYEQKMANERLRLAKEVADEEQRLRAERYSQTHEMLGNLSTLMNSKSRKMFEIGKAAAIANALVSMYEGATKSYTALAGIPIVGPALAFGAKAAAIASGLASIASIRSVSFGGGGGGGSSSGVSNTQAVNAAMTPVGNAALGGGSQTMDVRIVGTSRPSWEEVAQTMEMIGDNLARSGGRLGKVTVLTA